jgi:hypothetical protein
MNPLKQTQINQSEETCYIWIQSFINRTPTGPPKLQVYYTRFLNNVNTNQEYIL